jgi:hypothetical protein
MLSLATQAVEHDTDLVLGRKMAPGLAPDVLHHPLSRGLAGRLFQEVWGFIFVPSSLTKPQTSLIHNLKSVPLVLTADNVD